MPPSSLRDFVEVVAIHNHHYFIHSQKNKRIHYYLINQRINFQFSIFNFQFFLNPPVASQHPPLQREANHHKPQNHYQKQKRKKFINRIIVPHTEIATNLQFSQWQWGLSTLVSHTEIATISAKSRNDEPRITEIATNLRFSQWQLFFSSLRGARRRSNPQTTKPSSKNIKEKEITIIYQVKELIFNKILIFNF